MSKFLISNEIKNLEKLGFSEDLIKLIMAEKYPDQFSKEEIIAEMQEENNLIYDEMIKKGFQPFHQIYSPNNILDGQTETQEEAKSQKSSEAESVTEGEPSD
jgi:hypothetical protein